LSTDNSEEALRKRLRDAIARSLVDVKQKSQPDDKDRREASAAEKKQKAETQSIVESNLDRRVNRKLRWKYARWVFCYLVCYSVFVGGILVLSGFGICGFQMSEAVLSTLVGSTAVSAIGLVLAVTTGLFKPI
jgi:hypothetical protein